MNPVNSNTKYQIRPMRPEDNPTVADIIRQVMTEFGAVGCGFSIEDAEVDNMGKARQLYLRYGFEPIKNPLGNTGHSCCNRFMKIEW
jgi:hypothetical protein